jgi:hypothetical protein
VVDSTVGVIPITRVDPLQDNLSSEAQTQRIENAGSKLLAKEYYNTVYDVKAMEGLPVGIQIVGPAWHEEKVLNMMTVLDDAVKKARAEAFGPGIASRGK